jgi:cytochrome bd ubiquinol oxidase subunit II
MLETIWFVIWGLLWAGYFLLDGFDLGLGALMPLIAKDESERKAIYRAVGPFWDGNEVWLIAAGGLTFAVFPGAYAAMFSALYSPLMLLLFALIIRGAALGLRGETESRWAKRAWDRTLALGSSLSALLFGVAFTNIFQGIPIDAEGVYQGSLLTFLNPYGLLGGALFFACFLVHGCLWLILKSNGELQARAKGLAPKLWSVLLALALVFLGTSAVFTKIWSQYLNHPARLVIPLSAVVSLLAVMVFMGRDAWGKAWIASALFIGSVVFFGLIGIYPALLPSSLDPAYHVTIYNSASSPLTLKIMLGVALIFIPIVIVYQALVYNLFKGKAESGEQGY